jgi:hypothetical protein
VDAAFGGDLEGDEVAARASDDDAGIDDGMHWLKIAWALVMPLWPDQSPMSTLASASCAAGHVPLQPSGQARFDEWTSGAYLLAE